MSEHDSAKIDYDDIKRRVRDAVRAAIQQRADELGIGYDACLARYFGRDDLSNSGDSDTVLTPPASSR
jgi:hypothetical protein